MKELQLVGYTADLAHLVFTDSTEEGGRFKAPIDEDFVATLTEVIDLVDPATVPLGALVTSQRSAPAEEQGGHADVDDQGGNPVAQRRGEGPLAAMAAASRTAERNGEAPVADRPRPSKLAPREIQALLRAGQGIKSVAKLADTEERWVRRWLPPIEAERDQVLQGVWSSFVAKTRLGVSADPVGDAVDRNLAAKGVRPDDPTVEWIAARREGDTHWKVTLRYRSRGRAQRATWHFNPETGALDPRNDLAVNIAWTRTRRPASSSRDASLAKSATSGSPGRKAVRPGTKKAAAAKKRSAKKAMKKATKKKAAKKRSARKAAAGKKRSAAKKAAAKKAPAKKAPAKKAPAKKAPAKKAPAKKAPAKKAPAKKTAVNKTAAKKAAADPAPAKKSAAKKSTAKKSTAKKTTAKKTTAKKTTAKKTAGETSAPQSAATPTTPGTQQGEGTSATPPRSPPQ